MMDAIYCVGKDCVKSVGSGRVFSSSAAAAVIAVTEVRVGEGTQCRRSVDKCEFLKM